MYHGDIVPHDLWVNGVGGLLFARVMIFESPHEDEQRKSEMLVCNECKEAGMAMLNPKNMDGHRPKMPTCNFVVGVSVLRKGPLEPELKLNQRRLAEFKITAAKWGNYLSAPAIIRDDARLLWKVKKHLPPPAYAHSLLLLQKDSSTKGAGILLQECVFD